MPAVRTLVLVLVASTLLPGPAPAARKAPAAQEAPAAAVSAPSSSSPMNFSFDPRVQQKYRSDIVAAARTALARAEALLGPARGPVSVRVEAYHGSFIQEYGGASWAIASAGGSTVTLALNKFLWKLSVTSSDPGTLDLRSLSSVLTHELAHVLVFGLCPTAPSWLNEGLAQMADGTDVNDAVSLAYRKLDTCDAGRADLVMRMGSFGSIAATPLPAYQMALALTRYLGDTHGADAPRRFLAAMAGGTDHDGALRLVTGQSREEFLRDWRSWLYDWALRGRKTGE